jgi:hypothetical protein
MTVESASSISQLNPAYPTGADAKSEGDDHIRLLKNVLKTQFPNFGAAALGSSNTQIDAVVGSFTISSGKVGIGTTPTYTLDVVGDIATQSASGAEASIRLLQSGISNWKLSIPASTAAFAITDTGAGAERLRIDATGNTIPGADNAQQLGSAAKRWSTVYAGTGTINTSDARKKSSVSALGESELAAASDLASAIGWFKFTDAISEKGDQARVHIGLTVQKAMQVMASHGLDPMSYGFICYDKWGEDEDAYGFRMDEMLAFVSRGQQEILLRQAQRMTELEQQIQAMAKKPRKSAKNA